MILPGGEDPGNRVDPHEVSERASEIKTWDRQSV